MGDQAGVAAGVALVSAVLVLEQLAPRMTTSRHKPPVVHLTFVLQRLGPSAAWWSGRSQPDGALQVLGSRSGQTRRLAYWAVIAMTVPGQAMVPAEGD
ncbi:MAG: hypothetical protein NVSMB32_05550 [Actinomycetota bacterium]